MTVRRVVEDDWAALRAVRLEMLADTPQAYLETVADAEARTEGEWRFRAHRGSRGPHRPRLWRRATRTLPGRWVGYLACFVDAPGQGHVVSVYVAPRAPGHRAGDRTARRRGGWARGEAALNRLHLLVHEHNDRARGVLPRYGFTETG